MNIENAKLSKNPPGMAAAPIKSVPSLNLEANAAAPLSSLSIIR
jgi:hypothetical protein